ncbi:hypothetical protein HY36_00160 [Hyphomonas atlantica]|uniref:Uncharacterized protein n=1 Tax=Hyphomonas atlantica TaxID=1280948 RepID=A0A059EB89_9PROT|nr:hypothetical protein HY36_00160 [Hyphomonas atlantica]
MWRAFNSFKSVGFRDTEQTLNHAMSVFALRKFLTRGEGAATCLATLMEP